MSLRSVLPRGVVAGDNPRRFAGGLLAAAAYDPAVAVSAATSSALAITALDTTNLRLTFTAPPNGAVIVRQHGVVTGATTNPQILVGVLDGSTVRARTAPAMPRCGAGATQEVTFDATTLVTGLTAGTSYTWDAAYGVETVVASTNIKYGGPNNTTGADAYGGYGFEIWSATGLLAGTHYDPATAATNSIASLLAITAFDTTNLRLTFTAPSSGSVIVRVRAPVHGTSAGTGGVILYGVLDGSSVRARTRPIQFTGSEAAPAVTDIALHAMRSLVTGLTPGTSYTWDAAYGVEVIGGSGAVSYGGPNDTTTDNAFGGFGFDIWDAGAALPL